MDYVPLEVDVDFTQMNPQCYDVAILDDDIVETPESFTVELTNVVGFSLILQSRVTVTIIPNQDNLDSKVTKYDSMCLL